MAHQHTAYRMKTHSMKRGSKGTIMVMMKGIIMPIDLAGGIETQKKNNFIAGATSAKTLMHCELSINHRILFSALDQPLR
jgi:hypothetical protein